MSFISYAQNFEDVMLWRALKHIPNGFYVDIGAQDPVIDSVSLGFYEHGWRGVHVEPTMQYANKLRAARPDETVMQVAIGSSHGSLTFFEFKDTGLSTADPAIAQQHKEHGFECLETQVPTMSLDALLDQGGARTVHWLKLDVEGLEKSVLESWQVSAVRPWILVIESTSPRTQELNYAVWEPMVIAKGYEFAYFDGLNRFYVSQEHIHLKGAFDRPPNIFDGFVLSCLASQPFYARATENMQQAESRAQQAESRASIAETRTRQALILAEEARAHAVEIKALGIQTQTALHAVLHSRSWRVTAPLRWLGKQARRLRDEGLVSRVKALSKKIARLLVRRSISFIEARSGLRRKCVAFAHKFGIYQALRSLYFRLSRLAPATHASVSGEVAPGETHLPLNGAPSQLPDRAKGIYSELKAAIAARKREGGQ